MGALSAYLFYKKYRAHQNYCLAIKQILQQPIQKNINDYSAFFPAGVMLGEYLWQIYSIDPSVIKAVDFSSSQDLDSPMAIANYLLENMLEHDAVAYTGFQSRLMGYLGEQRVAEILQQQGTDALWASTSNQEIWDLKIDGQLMNVKTVLDVHSIKAIALAHPDVTYLVPEDCYQNMGIDNIQPLQGFEYQDVHQQLEHTQDQIDGTAAFDNASVHFPVISAIKALDTRHKLIQAGGDVDAVNKNVLIDFTAKSTTSLAMGKLGGIIGSGLGSLMFMPVVGGIFGAALGSFWGAKKGQGFGRKIKEVELQKQKLKMNSLLEKFGIKYFPYIEKIKKYMTLTAKKQQQALDTFDTKFSSIFVVKSWKNHFFENPNTIFSHELRTIGERIYAIEQKKSQQQITILNTIQSTKDAKALALLIINHVHLRDFLYVDLVELKKIYAQKDQVYLERFKLYPDQYPLTKKF